MQLERQSYSDNDTVPPPTNALSAKLAERLSECGLSCLKPVLENVGVVTYVILGKLTPEDRQELASKVRAAGFGLGHSRNLGELCQAAGAEAELQKEASDDDRDLAPVLTNVLSPKLHFSLARKGLQRLEPILKQNGVQSWATLSKLTENECQELEAAMDAVRFAPDEIRAFHELWSGARSNAAIRSGSESPEGRCKREASSIEPTAKRPKIEKIERENSPDGPLVEVARLEKENNPSASNTSDSEGPLPAPKGSINEKGVSDALILERKASKSEDQIIGKVTPPVIDITSLEASRVRVSRQAILDQITYIRSLPTEECRYRDKVTGKTLDARVPKALLAILRLRSMCNGKEETEQRINRLAMDIMEEQAYDPVRAIASLQPELLLCPKPATHLLGSGAIGIVWLEEETGVVVKTMLEDFAEREYEIFCSFADAGIAPRPMSLCGGQELPGGKLFSIRMEAISQTLQNFLDAKKIGGLRRGLSPPSEIVARKISEALVKTLERMWERGLVHGDLHLENIALKDVDSKPFVQVIDFGRSARNVKATQSCASDALRAGHEYDVFRLIQETIKAFEDLEAETNDVLKECKKEMRALQSCRVATAYAKDPSNLKSKIDSSNLSQLHDARQIVGLQAFIADEQKALERAELAYNAVLAVISEYAFLKLDLSRDDTPTVRSRRLKQAVNRRLNLCFKGYFKSDLFWDGNF